MPSGLRTLLTAFEEARYLTQDALIAKETIGRVLLFLWVHLREDNGYLRPYHDVSVSVTLNTTARRRQPRSGRIHVVNTI